MINPELTAKLLVTALGNVHSCSQSCGSAVKLWMFNSIVVIIIHFPTIAVRGLEGASCLCLHCYAVLWKPCCGAKEMGKKDPEGRVEERVPCQEGSQLILFVIYRTSTPFLVEHTGPSSSEAKMIWSMYVYDSPGNNKIQQHVPIYIGIMWRCCGFHLLFKIIRA